MDRASAIFQGRAQDVAVGLRPAATRKQLSQNERKPVDKAADYIDNNRERLQYDRALAHGLPIATSVIEGACRHLVEAYQTPTADRCNRQAQLQLSSAASSSISSIRRQASDNP